MSATRIPSVAAAVALLQLVVVQCAYPQPTILSLDRNNTIQWTNASGGLITVVEGASTIAETIRWEAEFYDLSTNTLRRGTLPVRTNPSAFYRLSVVTHPPDPSLLVHLSFDNDFTPGLMVDASGHGHHGLRYGRPGTSTNWPSAIPSVDGSLAAEFHYYSDGYGRYGRSGDYIGIPWSPDFTNLTTATISAWIRYYRSPGGNLGNDHNSTIFDTGHVTKGAWKLGRAYSGSTSFLLYINDFAQVDVVTFPDFSPDGDSKGWHHYLATYDNGVATGYFDGRAFATNIVNPSVPLSIGGYYIGISCWTFNVTPALDLSVDEHPNNGWINGAVDELRIYRRALNPEEVASLHAGYNKVPPSIPANVVATPLASTLVSLKWEPAFDQYGISHYIIRKNGILVAEHQGTLLVDKDLSPSTTYSYTIQSVDNGGLISPPSAVAVAVTPPAGSPIEIIVDDADGPPWISAVGTWLPTAFWPGYYGDRALSDNRQKGGSVTFTPFIPESGVYSVFVQYPGTPSQSWQMSAAVPIDIAHANGTNRVSLNQKVGFGSWNLLGTFTFDSGTNGHVRILNDGTAGSYVQADAVRFVK